MSLQPPPKPALGDAEIDALNDLLELRAVPFKGMSLEMLDGFLSAIAVGPEPVAADEWMAKVWGARPPRWESPAESDRVADRLMALWHDVLRRIVMDPEEAGELDSPLIALPDHDEEAADPVEAVDDETGLEWAIGFLEGVDLRVDAWEALAASEEWVDEALWCIEALAAGEWPGPEGEASEGTLDPEERLEIVAGLPQMLHDLHLHRFEKSVSRIPIRKQDEPGRNDPCPCGSGKKYKKCHGNV